MQPVAGAGRAASKRRTARRSRPTIRCCAIEQGACVLDQRPRWRRLGEARDAHDRDGCSWRPTARPCCRRWSGSAPSSRRRSDAIERDLGCARPTQAATSAPSSSDASRTAASPRPSLRALIYIRVPRTQLRRARLRDVAGDPRPCSRRDARLSMAELKAMPEGTILAGRLDEERAVRAIPKLLPDDEHARQSRASRRCTAWWRHAARSAAEGKRRLGRVESAVRRPRRRAACSRRRLPMP